MVEGFLKDVRYAVRGLAVQPGFALVALASLAVGIGLNSAMFSVVNAVLLRPLPVDHPERLVRVYTTADVPESTFSVPDFRDLQRRTSAFSGLAGHSLMFANASRDGSSQLLLGEVVTANYFDVLGIRAALGRGFDASEDLVEGGNRVVVISDRLWRRQFGGDPGVLGKLLRIRGADYTIVGVMPERFTGMTPGLMAELWVPASMVADVEPVGMNDVVPSPTGASRFTRRGSRWMFVTGRLAGTATLAEARGSVESVMNALQREYPATNRDRRGVVRSASDVRIHPIVDGALLPGAAAIMVAVALVLLVACANIANMLLARGSSRAREMAIRLAIGAGRARLVRQLLAESFVLAALGGLAGLLLAAWSLRLISRIQVPLPIPIAFDLSLDARVFAFTATIALLTGVVFGLAPALQATRPDLVPSLKNDPPSSGTGRRYGLRDALVVAQVTLSALLLVSAALLTRSAMAASRLNVGFDAGGLAVATVDLAMHRYTADRGKAFYREAIERVSGLPGVTSAALVERLPFSPNIHTRSVFIDGRSYPSNATGESVDVTTVTSGYFRTLGVPLVRGRDFDAHDTPESPGVIVINQAMAQKYWPGANPIGRRVRVREEERAFEIVGVVGDHKVRTIGEGPTPLIHFARSQAYAPSATVLARTTGSAARLAQDIRRELLALDPQLVFIENQTMEAEIAATLFPVRAGAALGTSFGILALLLAGVGLYGVTAFWVSRRTREIGVRIALGASPTAVVGLVLAQGMARVLVGLAAGMLVAAAAARALTSLLYGVGATDPLGYAAATALTLGVSVLANVIPARRAARVDPVIALRST
jgi:predicted permease